MKRKNDSVFEECEYQLIDEPEETTPRELKTIIIAWVIAIIAVIAAVICFICFGKQ